MQSGLYKGEKKNMRLLKGSVLLGLNKGEMKSYIVEWALNGSTRPRRILWIPIFSSEASRGCSSLNMLTKHALLLVLTSSWLLDLKSLRLLTKRMRRWLGVSWQEFQTLLGSSRGRLIGWCCRWESLTWVFA